MRGAALVVVLALGLLGTGGAGTAGAEEPPAGGFEGSWSQFSLAGSSPCGVTTAGAAYCWGDDDSGQLGNGPALTGTQPTPTLVVTPPGVRWASVSAGSSQACGRTTEGQAYCWGADSAGRLGNGPDLTAPQEAPSAVSTPPGVTWRSVTMGQQNACGVTTTGDAYCWGGNGAGSIGNGTAENEVPSPSLVLGGPWASVTPSDHDTSTCGVTVAGAAYCWGRETTGDLGNGPEPAQIQLSPSPVVTPEGVTWASIDVVGATTCGLTTTGAAYCWGRDEAGAVGDGGAIGAVMHVPTLVATPPGVVWSELGALPGGTCGLTTSGAAYCWGANLAGQLGAGPAWVGVSNSPSPVAVDTPPGVTWASAPQGSSGGACAIATDGRSYCWGDNRFNQFGTGGEPTNAPSPVVTPSAPDADGDGILDGADLDDDEDGLDDADDPARFDPDVDDDGDLDGGDNCVTTANPDQADGDGDGVGTACDPDETDDADGDGIDDEADNCPTVANANQADLDDDDLGDACDPDIDGDGVLNGADPFPTDPDESVDTDGDGTGNNSDDDDDEDGLDDALDPAPLDPDADDDGDLDGGDNCVTVANASQADLDDDGLGDACDPDIDGDGVLNGDDAFPTDPDESADADGDGTGNDGDNCPVVPNADQADLDGNGVGDACDGDIDGDGVLNGDDAFPTDPDESVDTDGDGTGNNSDDDDDEDGLDDALDPAPLDPDADDDGDLDGDDNCVTVANASQADLDDDGLGDACDPDIDGDGILNGDDAFPTDPDESGDADGDGVGNTGDNCPVVANTNQADLDGNGVGDACDPDIDGDGVLNGDDAFPTDASEWWTPTVTARATTRIPMTTRTGSTTSSIRRRWTPMRMTMAISTGPTTASRPPTPARRTSTRTAWVTRVIRTSTVTGCSTVTTPSRWMPPSPLTATVMAWGTKPTTAPRPRTATRPISTTTTSVMRATRTSTATGP